MELKDLAKSWSVDEIIDYVIKAGMAFMIDRLSNEELIKDKEILVDELQKRIVKN